MDKKEASTKRRLRVPSNGDGAPAAAAAKKRVVEINDNALSAEASGTMIPAKSIAATVLLSNDILGGVSSFLACKDLLHLSLTCQQMTDAVEEVARQMIASANVRYGGDDADDLSALGQMHRLLFSPIEFTDLSGPNIEYLRGNKACVYSINPNEVHTPHYIDEMNMEYGGDWDGWEGETCTAICSDYVMTSGRHFAKFSVTSLDVWGEDAFRYFYCWFGLMRPIQFKNLDVFFPGWCPIHDQLLTGSHVDGGFAEQHRTDAWGESDVHCCLYYDFDSTCVWSNWNSKESGIHKSQRWEGMRGINGSVIEATCEYGLLLDLDVGTLSMYQGNRCLGVMMRGLTGEYCWVANVLAQAHGTPDQQNIRIERASVPSEH